MRIHLAFLAIIICIITTYVSCKKFDKTEELPKPPEKIITITEKFFAVPEATNSNIRVIAKSISKQNEKTNFVEGLVKRIGFPRWDKAKIATSSGLINIETHDSGYNSIAYIPFAIPDSNTTVAILAIGISSIDTVYNLIYPQEYKQYGFDTTAPGWNARNVFHLFTEFDYSLFGRNTFLVTDGRIFGQNENDTLIVSRQNPITAGRIGVESFVEVCMSYTVSPPPCGCPVSTNSFAGPITVTVCNTFWMNDSPGPLPPGGGSSGGGGNSSSTWPSEWPCPPALPRQMVTENQNLCQGGWSWWINLPDPIPLQDYEYRPYTLTAEDQAIWNQIEQEDAEQDAGQQNRNCQGTQRTGNFKWPGTIEHWLIMLDFVAMDPVFHDVEYAIPGSSAAGNRGYADLVSSYANEIYEIKPANPAGDAAGEIEADRYVNAASINCTVPNPVHPFTPYWHKGTGYVNGLTKRIPSHIPLMDLEISYRKPGVIGYQYLPRTPHIPQPVVIPSSVLDKLRNLVKRLKDHVGDAKEVISGYLREHPELVTVLKTIAYGAAVSIIVGTILEDIATLGVGIADDWASFTLAFKIIRIARAM